MFQTYPLRFKQQLIWNQDTSVITSHPKYGDGVYTTADGYFYCSKQAIGWFVGHQYTLYRSYRSVYNRLVESGLPTVAFARRCDAIAALEQFTAGVIADAQLPSLSNVQS